LTLQAELLKVLEKATVHSEGRVASGWYQSLELVCVFQAKGGKRSTLIHTTCVRVVSEPGTCLCISGERRKEEHSDTHDLRQGGITERELEFSLVG
jgi:hypothetical protein